MEFPLQSFCFADLYASNPVASARFYAQLIGWSVHEASKGVSTFQIGAHSIAGLRPASAGVDRWVPYVRADVDAAATKAQSLGAVILMRRPQHRASWEYDRSLRGRVCYRRTVEEICFR